MYIVGIDIGKRHHEATVIDSQGNIRGKSLRFVNSHAGFNKLLELVRKLSEKMKRCWVWEPLDTTGWRFIPI